MLGQSQVSCDSHNIEALKESTLKCVSMSLKTLIFKRVWNMECELKFVRYVVKNAEFLKQMKIRLGRLVRELLDCHRASMTCDINFSFEPNRTCKFTSDYNGGYISHWSTLA